MKRRVAITGVGLVDPLGESIDSFFDRTIRGESSIRHYSTNDIPVPISIPAVYCANFNGDAILGKPRTISMDRFSQMGLVAAFDAWTHAGFDINDKSPKPDIGVSWGTALGGTRIYEQGLKEMWQNGRERLPPLSVVMGMNNACSSHIAIQLGLGNSSLSYTVACSSASAAIGEAYRRIRDGDANVMVAGGSDTPLIYGVIRAWDGMRVLSPGDEKTSPNACRPFDKSRSGLVLGEGAAALILEEWDHAVARNAPIIAELGGYGSNCDHTNLVKPDSNGQVAAISLALNDAGVAPESVGYINAHGTATVEGDPSEIEALRIVFGDQAKGLAVSSTKSTHGHLMGASGAIEAVITVLSIKNGVVPPTANLRNIDPACEGVRHIRVGDNNKLNLKAAISNSFAFGGSNAVLVFKSV
ncbi:beta-ketoacyl-[acyl-carrier-protein] synthase family protein [Polynucleobacter paneuropaeus]|jgi:3-oxoacyl-[acyl-carrier-protein] synthase II|nr:beta-ketoacyl-[acyl-carrier-protein] synthase family protein [Polynucleobacter paneuropaeus]